MARLPEEPNRIQADLRLGMPQIADHVVIIADPRIVTKGYGRSFITSLPPMRRTRLLEEVQAFLRERLGTASPVAVT